MTGTPTTPNISIVVCVYNGAATIDATMAAVTTQTVPAPVIVVDDGSTDTTAQQLTAWAAHPLVTIITHPHNQGLSAARNTGWQHTTTELVAFTDADCVPPPRWAQQLQTWWPTDAEGFGGIVTTQTVDTLNRRYTAWLQPLQPLPLGLHSASLWHRVRYQHQRLKYTARIDGPVLSLVGANMAYRTHTLETVGGFTPTIRFGGDETDLADRINRRYGTGHLHVNHRISVAHNYHPQLRDTLRRAAAYGHGNGRQWRTRRGVPTVPVGPALLGAALLAGPAAAAAAGIAWYLPDTPNGKDRAAFTVISAAADIACLAGFLRGVTRPTPKL